VAAQQGSVVFTSGNAQAGILISALLAVGWNRARYQILVITYFFAFVVGEPIENFIKF